MTLAGEVAALATAFSWSCSALAFDHANRRLGSLTLNLVRLSAAVPVLALCSFTTRGLWWPTDASSTNWVWLSLSAAVGLVWGDYCLFQAFHRIGPRLSILLMSTSPLWSTLFGFVFLGEHLSSIDFLGILLTVAGIAWAVSSHHGKHRDSSLSRHQLIWGLLLAISAALGQSGGLLLSKHGMGNYDVWGATQIRMITGSLLFILICTLSRSWANVMQSARDRAGMRNALIGTLLGPVFGVTLSLYAVRSVNIGVAASLMATTPILMLPMSKLRGETIGWGGVGGAIVAVLGVCMLFL